jgi:hypothetical protein
MYIYGVRKINKYSYSYSYSYVEIGTEVVQFPEYINGTFVAVQNRHQSQISCASPFRSPRKPNLTKKRGKFVSMEGVRKRRKKQLERGGVEKGERGCSPISGEKKIEKRIDPARISMIK